MEVSYQYFENAWHHHYDYLTKLILTKKLKKICEVGGGANPILPLSFIEEHQLEYTILDISKEELAKAPAGYHKILGDITCDHLQLNDHFDLVFSKMLAEHVKSGKKFHEHIKKMLKTGGVAFHFFPTLYAAPFMTNKLFPESWSAKIISLLFKHRQGHFGKFPGFYSMCFGPTKQQIRSLQKIGYRIDHYIGFFGHGYFKKIPFLNSLHEKVTHYLLKKPIPHLTSYSYIVLTKLESA